ncbi:MAG: hypothetical protein Fur0020_05140 [Thermodesulfovibrionia bacterium]
MKDDIRLLKTEIKRLRRSLSELTPPLETLLKRRGFIIHKKEPSNDLLIPDERYIDHYYEKLKRYSFRLFLRDVIKHQELFGIGDVTRYATREVTSRYIDFLLRIGMIERRPDGYRLKHGPIKSFGETLEWFMARLMNREFGLDAIWGIRFKGMRVGGDYDLIAKFNSSILYMEIKSSPPKQIYDKEVSAFLDRVNDLIPEMAIFFVDTELRMKDKIVPMFEERLKKGMVVERLKKELFHIGRKIFIINSKDSIMENVRTVMDFYWHNRVIEDRRGYGEGRY